MDDEQHTARHARIYTGHERTWIRSTLAAGGADMQRGNVNFVGRKWKWQRGQMNLMNLVRVQLHQTRAGRLQGFNIKVNSLVLSLSTWSLNWGHTSFEVIFTGYSKLVLWDFQNKTLVCNRSVYKMSENTEQTIIHQALVDGSKFVVSSKDFMFEKLESVITSIIKTV